MNDKEKERNCADWVCTLLTPGTETHSAVVEAAKTDSKRLHEEQAAAAVVVMALAVTAKVFALLIVPWLLWRLAAKYWLLFGASLLALYAPFILQGGNDFFSLFVFAQHWEFNAAIYAVLNTALSDGATKLLLAAVFLVWLSGYFFYTQRRPEFSLPRADWVFALFLLLAPVINAWYWLWVLPFAVIYPSVWAWTASVALLLSYCVGLHIPGSELEAYAIPLWLRIVEFGVIALAAMVDLRCKRKIVASDAT